MMPPSAAGAAARAAVGGVSFLRSANIANSLRIAAGIFVTPKAVLRPHQWEVLGTVVRGIISGLDDLSLIFLYLCVAEPGLKLLWNLSNMVARARISHNEEYTQIETTSSGQQAAETLVPVTASKSLDGQSSYETSLANALQPSVRLFGYCLLVLWLMDASYLGLTAAKLANGDGKIPKILSILAYTVCAGSGLTSWKNHWIASYFKRNKIPGNERATGANEFLLRRGSGIALWGILGLVCLDAISVNVGVNVGSLLSFAGVGGLAFGFASKDLASNLVGGCLIFATRSFAEGDTISFGSVPQSKVTKMGWYQTTVIGLDEQVRTVPNSMFVSNTISNLSRRSHRTLKVDVRLSYGSLPVAGKVVERLKEVLGEMPGLNKTTRNFRVSLKDLTPTSVDLEVEAHFRGANGNLFRERRTAALLAIADVVKECGAEFAVLNGLLAVERPESKK